MWRLPWPLKDNMDFFKHLYHIPFKGHNLYLNNFDGSCSSLLRRSYFKGSVPEMRGTLDGWVAYLIDRFDKDKLVSGFYDGVFMLNLDMKGTNQKIYEFDDYKSDLEKMGRIHFGQQEFSQAIVDCYTNLRNQITEIVKTWQL